MLFWLDMYFDFYLTYVIFGLAVKYLFVFAVLCNIIGIITAAIGLKRRLTSARRAIAALALNAVPLAAVGCLIYWFFFVFRM
jgi:hypothetical protein